MWQAQGQSPGEGKSEISPKNFQMSTTSGPAILFLGISTKELSGLDAEPELERCPYFQEQRTVKGVKVQQRALAEEAVQHLHDSMQCRHDAAGSRVWLQRAGH